MAKERGPLKIMAAMLLCMIFLNTGCTGGQKDSAAGAGQQAGAPLQQAGASESGGSLGQETQKRSTGEITYGDGGEALDEEQESLLSEYMDLYFESLAHLSLEDFRGLFSDSRQAEANEASIGLQIELRKMQEADYSLASYRYGLECRNVEESTDGTVQILAVESSVQNFFHSQEIDSERYGTYHRFVLEKKDGKWYIKRHMMVDPLYLVLARNNWSVDRTEEYLEQAPAYLELIKTRMEERKEGRGQTVSLPKADHPYNAQAALEYAAAYAHGRNSQWFDFSGWGGNCQNYISQCLYASGIPMDLSGDQVWKYYGPEVANNGRASGRSSSWSGVGPFVTYARLNKGYGLSALVEAPYYSGQPGDLIQMGTEDKWRHTVMISSLVQNQAGETVDYLIYSNTGDMKNYPASLYGYPEYILTRVAGWNEG